MSAGIKSSPILVGAITGVLIVAIGAGSFFYFRSKKAIIPITPPVPMSAAPRDASVASKPDRDGAMKELFGAAASASGFKTSAGISSFLHEQSFVQGNEKMHVIFTKTQAFAPGSDLVIDSHAQSVKLSAVVYKLDGSKWSFVSKTKDFADYGQWGDGTVEKPADILTFPTGVMAFLFDGGSTGQGYTESGKYVFSYSNHEWRSLGFVTTGEDNEGAVGKEDPAYYSNEGVISALPGSNPVYPDLLVTRSGTMQNDNPKIVRASNMIYKIKGEVYTRDGK